jgi:excisionase family DNA binding protein
MGGKSQQETTIDTDRRAVDEGFASVAEASKFLSLSRATLYKLMDCGELAYAKFGRSRRLPWAALKEYAAKAMIPNTR